MMGLKEGRVALLCDPRYDCGQVRGKYQSENKAPSWKRAPTMMTIFCTPNQGLQP